MSIAISCFFPAATVVPSSIPFRVSAASSTPPSPPPSATVPAAPLPVPAARLC